MNQIYFFKARFFNEHLSLVCINITINTKNNPKIYNTIILYVTNKKTINISSNKTFCFESHSAEKAKLPNLKTTSAFTALKGITNCTSTIKNIAQKMREFFYSGHFGRYI